MQKDHTFKAYEGPSFDPEQSVKRSEEFYSYMNMRRSVRMFSDRPVSKKLIENLIMAASTAPSGAHKQPWTFCAISDPVIKADIKAAAEEEEYENYHGRMSEEWLEDLKAFNTDWHKEFLEIAPWLIVVFKRSYEMIDGKRTKNYYVNESVGLATGMLLTAIHQAGLVSLTHTPSPMNFLTKVLARPENERPFLLIPIGYPAKDAEVPVLERKKPSEVVVYYE